MIAFVDGQPAIEPHNGLFLLTAKSGDETIQIAFTRHALIALELQCKKAEAMGRIAEMNAKPIKFPKPKRSR